MVIRKKALSKAREIKPKSAKQFKTIRLLRPIAINAKSNQEFQQAKQESC